MNFFTDPRWSEALSHLPDYLGNHINVSITALALGLIVSLPLALLARHRPVLRHALLGVASVVQTIPGLALLALFYPLLLAITGMTQDLFSFGFSAFGFLPSVMALSLYAMLPVLRNTITGLEGLDPAVIEAADGVGMTARQKLFKVELPLALPVMMAGIRTAAVWVIGTATLATPIGQTSLGNYIFAGLQTQNWVFVLFGCVAAALLALAVDQLLALIETGVARRSRMRTMLGATGMVALLVVTLMPSFASSKPRVVVGAKTFTEQYILGALLAQRLNAAGFNATSREGLGSNVIYEALAAGDIDTYVDYSGTIWFNQFKRSDIPPRAEMFAEMKKILAKDKITLFGNLGFENAYGLMMPRERAESLGVKTISDLVSHAPEFSMAADFEFVSRPEWSALKEVYNIAFKLIRQMQPDLMYAAVASGEVDVIAGYTSDGLIAKYDLVVLDDADNAMPHYDAILLMSDARAADPKFRAALAPLIDKIDIANMRAANLRAAGNNAVSSSGTVAAWLWERISAR